MTTALPPCSRAAMQLFVRAVATATVALAWVTPAQAEEPTGWRKGDVVVSAGVSQILFNSSAEISLAGNKVTEGNVKLSNNTLLTGAIEYFATVGDGVVREADARE